MKKKIIEILQKQEFECYGLRVDNLEYDIGDIAYNSHNLYQDPLYDYDDELVFPLIKSGIYAGFYDGGEIDGTCSIEITLENIDEALKLIENYEGNYIHLIANNNCMGGDDNGEIIINNAKVLAKWEI